MFRLSKKDLLARAKKMKVAAQTSPTKDLMLKFMAEVVPSNDEEIYYGSVFKRRRKVDAEPAEHYASNGRAPSPQAHPPSPPPSQNIVVQEGVGASAPVGGLWDPTLNAPTFLEKTFLSAQANEKLESLEEDQLVEQAVRQLGQALVVNCLTISKLTGWKGSAKEETHKVAELSRQVDGLKHKLHEELK